MIMIFSKYHLINGWKRLCVSSRINWLKRPIYALCCWMPTRNGRNYIRLCWCSSCHICMVSDDRTRRVYSNTVDRNGTVVAEEWHWFSCNWRQAQLGMLWEHIRNVKLIHCAVAGYIFNGRNTYKVAVRQWQPVCVRSCSPNANKSDQIYISDERIDNSRQICSSEMICM